MNNDRGGKKIGKVKRKDNKRKEEEREDQRKEKQGVEELRKMRRGEKQEQSG